VLISPGFFTLAAEVAANVVAPPKSANPISIKDLLVP
jgi:hypothetical protein